MISTVDPTLTKRQIGSVVWNTTGNCTQLSSAAADDGSFYHTDIWYLLNPTAATGNIVVTVSDTGPGTCDYLAAGATNFQGVHQTTPFGTPATATGTSTTISVSVTGVNAGEYTLGVCNSDANSGIAPTGTQLWEIEGIGADASAAGQYYTSSGSVSVQWSQGTEAWAVSGVALKPSDGGGGTPTVTWVGYIG
jgi:hypothetical protein